MYIPTFGGLQKANRQVGKEDQNLKQQINSKFTTFFPSMFSSLNTLQQEAQKCHLVQRMYSSFGSGCGKKDLLTLRKSAEFTLLPCYYLFFPFSHAPASKQWQTWQQMWHWSHRNQNTWGGTISSLIDGTVFQKSVATSPFVAIWLFFFSLCLLIMPCFRCDEFIELWDRAGLMKHLLSLRKVKGIPKEPKIPRRALMKVELRQ